MSPPPLHRAPSSARRYARWCGLGLGALLLLGSLLDGHPAGAADPVATLEPGSPTFEVPRTDPAALAAVAADALRYLDQARGLDPLAYVPAEVRETLALVVGAGEQLRDPSFLTRCFEARRWVPDSDRWGGQIRLTRYLVFEVEGRSAPDEAHGFALYALPRDEAGLSPEQARGQADRLTRFRYTRQEIANGVFLTGGAAEGAAEPLVWLTHQDHEQALMQGTTAVQLPDGVHLFNVHRDNGIPYDRGLTDSTLQRRYWYFREVDRVGGWGMDPLDKITLQPMAAVAGDLPGLGLGRLLALRSADGLRLVVLADTGGAFAQNLHQLDLYSGIFPDRAAFRDATASVGDTAEAWVLVRRPGACDPPAR